MAIGHRYVITPEGRLAEPHIRRFHPDLVFELVKVWSDQSATVRDTSTGKTLGLWLKHLRLVASNEGFYWIRTKWLIPDYNNEGF